ncbi:hypothetical protein RJT34_06234 [Clitoria ternatea]|uniref:Uncharacterized protein n=1 Tax=Clitoria ternatea TaxID=43366 RepID=A0AAN9K430_CLITE
MNPQNEEVPLLNHFLISSSPRSSPFPDIPIASETIVMLSPLPTQDQDATPQDVFITPMEDSSPFSSAAEPSHVATRENPTCKLNEIRDMKGACGTETGNLKTPSCAFPCVPLIPPKVFFNRKAL